MKNMYDESLRVRDEWSGQSAEITLNKSLLIPKQESHGSQNVLCGTIVGCDVEPREAILKDGGTQTFFVVTNIRFVHNWNKIEYNSPDTSAEDRKKLEVIFQYADVMQFQPYVLLVEESPWPT